MCQRLQVPALDSVKSHCATLRGHVMSAMVELFVLTRIVDAGGSV